MVKLYIRVIPNAKNSEVTGKEGGVWKLRLAAPPIEGRANEELLEFLSKKLDVPKSLINILKGHASRQKILDIPGGIEDIEERLA
jgi:uncharacterized protein (TIGR00251 family)